MAPAGPRAFASAVLAPAGVRTLYGDPVPGLPVVAADERIAGVLARAHRVVRNAPAGTVAGSGAIDIPGATGDQPNTIAVSECTGAGDLIRAIRAAIQRGGVRIQLDVDPAREWAAELTAPPVADAWLEDHDTTVERITPAESIVVLAGPGVVSGHAVPGLHSLSQTLGAGVLNTWGAKGIFHWRSRYHWATIGLQEHDFRLAGIDQAELLVAVGVDDREAPPEVWSNRPHLVVAPEALAPLSEVLPARKMKLELPPLRASLAAATQRGWASVSIPLVPSRVTLHYGRQLAPGGVVAADAGTAGFWVARTFATTELGAVAVPAETDPGWAAACVVVARLGDPLRPALAVVEDRVDEATSLVLDFGARHEIAVGVEVWSAGGKPLNAAAHEDRLAGLMAPAGGGVESIRTDPASLDEFVAVAGPVRDWTPRRSARR
jgi:hypothetical protein